MFRPQLCFCLAVLITQAASAETYVVKPDGTGDFPTIQDAITAAAVYDTIMLADGIFTGPGNRDISYEGKTIGVFSQSGNPENCIIDCGGSPSDPHRDFIFYEDFEGGLEGVTITNGYAAGDGLEGSGGAILGEASMIEIRNCIITGNVAEANGGGVSFRYGTETFSSLNFYHCTFSNNMAANGGGVSFGSVSMSQFQTCIITGNEATEGMGGGVHGIRSIYGTYPGAWFYRCTIAGNHAAGDGGGFGGSLYVPFHETVIWDNCADGTGDQVFLDPGYVEFTCCVVDRIGVVASGESTVNYYPGTISEDPLFCHPRSCLEAPTSAGDYSVAQISPCLPANSPCGGRIGAIGNGCIVAPTYNTTWGGIKSRFHKNQ